jgi:hypothetical protein
MQKTLHDFAVLAPQEVDLRLRLDTLGHAAQVERARHRDHGGDDCTVVLHVGKIAHEVLIDLHRVDRQS